jgi:S-adenosyl-L-methionine hydrolase (adenosine-forming)
VRLEDRRKIRDDTPMSPATPKSHGSSRKPVITLSTDFGSADSCVAQMKGVIAGIAPDARVIDGTHGIPPRDILAGAVALDSMADAFAEGTVHVVVVDPGVGSQRAAVAVRTDRFTLVGPDNGVFTLVLDRCPPAAIFRLTDPAYHRIPVSPTFHGRDLFAPVAAHLANGVAIEKLGEPATTLVHLDIPLPGETPDQLTAVVLLADGFGNLITNLTRDRYDRWLSRAGGGGHGVTVNGKAVGEIKRTFAEADLDAPVAYFGSSERLEIAIRNGSAVGVFSSTARVVVGGRQV